MVHILDLNYLDLPHTIAAFLIETDEGPVLLETGPHSTIDNLTAQLRQRGYELSDVQHVIITHIHLDHAGAAWVLANHGAKVYLHPLGKHHMADPSKLYASAKRIYQDDMERLWGDLKPIPEAQLQTVAHGETIQIGDKRFTAWHTPGHAIHHIAWQLDDILFTGDVAGVCLEHVLVQPPCPPPDINLEDWEKSIELIEQLAPKKLMLTHFGAITNVKPHLTELKQRLRNWAEWIKPYWEKQVDPAEVTPLFLEYTNNELKKAGATEMQLKQYDAANPAWMSVAGLMRYWSKKGQ
jgi:glyoxylase-like metal-dependent hydrolase (beta-lactamase superfamily II)